VIEEPPQAQYAAAAARRPRAARGSGRSSRAECGASGDAAHAQAADQSCIKPASQRSSGAGPVIWDWSIGRNVRIDTRWATTTPKYATRAELAALAHESHMAAGD